MNSTIHGTHDQQVWLDEMHEQLTGMRNLTERVLTRIAKSSERESAQSDRARYHYEEASDLIDHGIEITHQLTRQWNSRKADQVRESLAAAIVHTTRGSAS